MTSRIHYSANNPAARGSRRHPWQIRKLRLTEAENHPGLAQEVKAAKGRAGSRLQKSTCHHLLLAGKRPPPAPALGLLLLGLDGNVRVDEDPEPRTDAGEGATSVSV